MKTKVLWHSNAPWSPTGYGQQTSLFVPQLHQHYDTGISSFYGLEGASINWNGIPVYPGLGGEFGNDYLVDHAKRHFDGGPRDGLVVTLLDVRARYAADPEKGIEWSRRSTVKRKYGLTLEAYEAILARGCAICGADGPRMALDHDHTTGQIRDALCSNCNNGLGRFADDPIRLRAAADYLEKHCPIHSLTDRT